MTGCFCDELQGKNNFPDDWDYAKFRVVDGGFGTIALRLGMKVSTMYH